MFRTKICGVTRVEDAVAAAESGAQAIGLNFYERSPRCVSDEHALRIAEAVRGGALVVGVFVNASAQRVAETAGAVRLDAVQLHGDEAPAFAMDLPDGLAVVRAIRRQPSTGLRPGADWAAASAAAGRPVRAVLVDAAAPPTADGQTVYGGSGETTDWPAVAAERPILGETPLILAGGLRPENVAAAIAATGADGVDTASGVESAPGVKDAALVRAFVRLADRAFAERTAGSDGAER